MQVVDLALQKTTGVACGEAMVAAIKGATWTSPRGPLKIDATSRDIVQTVCLRRVEHQDGKLWNIKFDKVDAVRDPAARGPVTGVG